MPEKILIKAGGDDFEGELDDSVTGKAIYGALPIWAKTQRWGGEIYFSIPVSCELEEDSREVLEEGELGYWPPGTAFCIFFGPTPASSGDEIRAASAVNIVGRVKGGLSGLWDVPDGAEVIDLCLEEKENKEALKNFHPQELSLYILSLLSGCKHCN